MKYKNRCIDCKKVISWRATRCRSCSKKNKNNPNWKDKEVGFGALHEWIKRRKPKPALCERCKKNPPFDLANISGLYKRDINDYQWMCRKCHMEIDGRMKRLTKELTFLGVEALRRKERITTIEVECEYCHKKFIKKISEINKTCHDFCSLKCLGKWRKEKHH